MTAKSKSQKYFATQTADGKISYSLVLNGVQIDDWVQNIHYMQCEQHAWDYRPLIKGNFGYDNLVHSVVAVFSYHKNIKDCDRHDKEAIAGLVHQGWAKNYIYWRDNEPWEYSHLYRKPYNPLGDNRRNKCALSDYKDLDADEKDKDLVIANIIYDLSGI
jgi:hypothetical protein